MKPKFEIVKNFKIFGIVAVLFVIVGLAGHIGTETRPKLLREAAVGNIAQWAKA